MLSETGKYYLGIITVILAFISYVPYVVDIYRGRTRPHAISWFIWTTLMAIGFVAQVVSNAGAGSILMGVGALQCLFIFGLSLKRGDRDINSFDKTCLVVAVLAIFLWVATSNPLYSIILVSGIDAVGCLPTIRKVFHRPYEETAITWFLNGANWILSILALREHTLINVLYPATLLFTNWLVLGIMLVRRRSKPLRMSPDREKKM